MKLLAAFLFTLLNQDAFLIKQSDIKVPLSDLDAYVYLLPSDRRSGFANNKQQIEKNIFTLLNVNIVYQHVIDNGLKDLEIFKSVVSEIEASDLPIDVQFINHLDVNKKQMTDAIKMYNLKTGFYKTMLSYVKDSLTDEVLNQLALEYYMVNKKEFSSAEKRDLSVITLDSDSIDFDLNSLLTDLSAGSKLSFEEKAADISTDRSKSINQGYWGEFKRSNFNYPFSEKVFNAAIGVIEEVLVDGDVSYIVRINDIIPEKQYTFAEKRSEIIKKIKDDAVLRKFQSIINEKARHKVEVNPELIAHVFERYKILDHAQ